MPEYSGAYLGGLLEQLGFTGPLRRMGSHVQRRKTLENHPSGRRFALKAGILVAQNSGPAEQSRLRKELKLRAQDKMWQDFLNGTLDRATYDAYLNSLPPSELVPPAYRHVEESHTVSAPAQAAEQGKKKRQKKQGRRRK